LCDSRTLVAVGPDSFRVLDVSSGRELLRSVLPEGTGELYSKSYGQGLCLSADARRAVTSLADGTLLVWDLTLARREAAGRTDVPPRRCWRPGGPIWLIKTRRKPIAPSGAWPTLRTRRSPS